MAFNQISFATIGLSICRGGATALTLMLLLTARAGPAWTQEVPGCGNLRNAFGPFDYRDPASRGNRQLVEDFHFNEKVRAMNPRGSTGDLIGDVDYTLRAFPNHHEALELISRYATSSGRKRWPNSSVPSAECYFARAMAFARDDAVVRLLYGNYLFKKDVKPEARKQFESALELAPDNIDVNYAAALFFLDLGEVDRARKLAKLAYDGGYPLQGLKRKLDELDARESRKSIR